MLDIIKIKNFYTSKNIIKKVKTQPTEWEKIFICFISGRVYCPECIKDSYNSATTRETTPLKIGYKVLE